MNVFGSLSSERAVKPTFTPVVSGLLQRACACGQHTASSGGECEECKKKRQGILQHTAVNNSAASEGLIQTKLAINNPGDEYEQEADRVANQVMANSTYNPVSGIPLHVQRFTGTSTRRTDEVPASVSQALGSSGKPLQPVLRHDMEQRFGHDFSQVRVHSDAAAEQSAQDVNAHAYTVGQNIVFGAGRFAPDTYDGQRLIAHELTHVVQQGHRGTDLTLMRSPIFASTFRICHQTLRDPTRFRVSEGGLRVTIDAYWGGEERNSPPPDVPAYQAFCRPDREFSVKLYDVGRFVDSSWGSCIFPTGSPTSRIWTNLPTGEYYLQISTADTGPLCCLHGNIEVSQERNLSGETCTQPPPGSLEILHTALDLAGLIPALGAVPDAINAGIYLIEGDWTNAGLSAVAIIPIFGDAATVGRIGTRTVVRITGEGIERVGREGIEAGLREARASQGAISREADEAIERAFSEGHVVSGEPLELIGHGSAREARQARGVSGRQVESAHGAPRSTMQGLVSYDPNAALTRLLPRGTHRAMDRFWQQEARRLARQGRTTWTAQEMFEAVSESIRRTPGLSDGEKFSHIQRLSDEIFVEFGLSPSSLVRLPFT